MKYVLRALLIATTTLLPLAALGADGGTGPDSKPAARFSVDHYLGHIKYLASDELGGRGTGSPGIDRAAEYIAEQFQAAGCEPGGADGSWFQPFEVRLGKKLIDEDARLEISGLEQPWRIRTDWIPLPFTALDNVDAPLAFAGYGIEASEFEYDDYAGFEAQDKVLLVFRYEPKAEDPEAKFGGQTQSRHALFQRKARTAARHGAKALLIVNPPNRDPETDELFEFNALSAQQTYPLPLAHITRVMAAAILKQAGAPDLQTLQEQLDRERKPLSRDLGLTVKLRPGVQANTVPAKNVLGLIRGSGGTQETIVVGAHYDHLGTRTTTSQPADPVQTIFNGADDNASGTAGVIELAGALKSGPPLRRNILFITFSGEERGLLGSRHYVGHPTIPLENIRAMVNLDMIGRLNLQKFTAFGTSSAAEFPALVEKAAQAADIQCRAARGWSADSDHASFLRRSIPALFLFTGVHKQYHQADDDWELIDAEGATRVLEMTHALVVTLANLEEGPAFTEPSREREEEQVKKPAIEEPKEGEDAAAPATRPAESDAPPSRGDVPVRLGIIPDTAGDDKPGLLVTGVPDGTPAKSAGLQEGDRIIKIGDDEIRDVYGYMRTLQQYKPGDEVAVVIVRNGETKTLKVKLEPATQRRPRQ